MLKYILYNLCDIMACIDDRYARQTIMPEINEVGQKKLKTKTILIIGLGALGSVQAELLTRAGIGKLILVDPDRISLSNLQRQALYNTKDIERFKVDVAKEHLKKINPRIKIDKYIAEIQDKPKLFDEADIILDGTDNLETRKFINEYCYKKKDILFCSAIRDQGTVLVIKKDSNYDFNSVFKNKTAELSCETGGVLNGTTHIVGSIAATEAIKLILGLKTIEGLFSFSLFNNRFDIFKIK